MENRFEKRAEIVIYHTDDGDVSVNAIIKNETMWLTQKAMAILFGCTADNIGLHLRNIYNSDELDEKSTTEDFSVVQKEGNRDIKRTQTFYNLDAMEEFAKSVNEFISFRKYDVLKDKGRISHEDAVKYVSKEYDIFNKTQKINSDFDKLLKKIENKLFINIYFYCII